VHGFRSSLRDWATKVGEVREVVAEAALAHTVRDKTSGLPADDLRSQAAPGELLFRVKHVLRETIYPQDVARRVASLPRLPTRRKIPWPAEG
jgi:hypothetical protein